MGVYRQWEICWVHACSGAPTVLEKTDLELSGLSFKNRDLDEALALYFRCGEETGWTVLRLVVACGFMKTSDDIRRKLFFQGKVFCCGRCHSKHTFHEGCPSEQENEEQQSRRDQNENRE